MKGNRRPIIYASRSLSKETLCCYREISLSRSLGIYKKFNEYVVSMNFVVETDHKPLQSLFNIHTYIHTYIRPYWEDRAHFIIVDDLLLCDERRVIPRSMTLEILDRIHTGHLSITK